MEQDLEYSELEAAAEDPAKMDAMLSGLGGELTDEERAALNAEYDGGDFPDDAKAPAGAEDPDTADPTKPEGEDGAEVDGEAAKDPDKPAAKKGGEPAEGEHDEPKPVVKTRDGKHDIPYSVLEAERRKGRELEQELEKLRQQSAAPAPAQPPTDTTDTGKGELDEQALIDEYGEELANPIIALHKENQQAKQEIADLRKWREQQDESKEADEATTVNEAIDTVFADAIKPGEVSVLRQWQQSGDPLWDAAVALDNRLIDDPEWAGKPHRVRFEEVIQRLGHAPKPAESDTKPEDLRAKADARLAEKAGETSIPRSLSDLPGGAPPDQTMIESIERMSPKDIETKLASMTPDQQEEFLARM
jgi:hypothetical protein